MPQGECKLCGVIGELQLSHFIPKFVGKWVKETSATGYIRLSENINRRAQDIAKEYWLCGSCEQLFSGWEREFANKVFYPFVKNENDTASYEGWLLKFCASLSWRTLSYMREKNPRVCDQQNDTEVSMLRGLADFLLGHTNTPGIYEQHLFPLKPIESTNASVPVNINRYLLRNMHMDILSNTAGEIMVYTKLPRFIVLGLAKHSQANKMRVSRVAIKGGKILPTNYFWPDGFAHYLFGKAHEVSELYGKMNPSQHSVVEKALRNDPERAAASETIAAFRYDLEMFGDSAFFNKPEANKAD